MSGYYKSILPFLTRQGGSDTSILYLGLGARSGIIFNFKILSLLMDLFSFLFTLMINRPHLIHVNPSLLPKSLVRDSCVILISRLFSKARVVVFFRGWNVNNEKFVENFYWFFKRTLFSADQFISLSRHSVEKINSWGVSNDKLNLACTVIDPGLEGFLKGLNSPGFIQHKALSDKIRILFLGRVVREKGLYELLEGFSVAYKRNRNIELVIAGNGTEFGNIRSLVRKNGLEHAVKFLGQVSGAEKYNALVSSHLFLLPSYTEGMPNSVLEAMASGCIVFGTPVGALVEFIENDLIKPLKARDSRSIAVALSDATIFQRNLEHCIATSDYARKAFSQDSVCASLLDVYAKTLNP